MRDDRRYRRLFWPVYAPSTLFGMANGATIPVQVVAAMHLGASASLAALVVAAVGAIQLLTTVHAGRLVDRLGDRRSMLLATLAAGALEAGSITALIWAGPGALALFVATTLLRAPALNVWSLARQAFVAERVPTGQVGRAMTGLGGTARIGNLVGPLLGGLLLLVLPLWSAYVLSVACAALAVAILYAPGLGGRLERAPIAAPTPTAPPAGSAYRPAAQGGSATDGGTAAAATERRTAATSAPTAWSRVVLAGVAITCLAVARVAQPVVVQLWGVHVGLTGSHISSLVVAVGAAVEIVLMFPGGALKDRLGRAIILVTCLFVYGTGFLLVVPLTGAFGIPGLVAAVVVMAVGNGLGAGVNMTIGADLSPAVGRGRFLCIWALFSNVGSLGGPLLISALVRVAPVAAAVYAIGAVALAGAAWMTVFARRIGLPGRTRRT